MKKNLVIMGTHPRAQKEFNWERTDCDIWMFNEAPHIEELNRDLTLNKIDASFQLHHEAIWKNPKNRLDPEYFKWLSSGKTPTMYMQRVFKEVPKSEKYPIEEILLMTKNVHTVIRGKEQNFKYFSSSPDFAFALVALMWKKGKRYKRVEVHGIELEMETEYQYQRTGYAFWSGYLAALGIEVVHYNSIFDEPIYGYEGDVALTSRDIKKRLKELKIEEGNDQEHYKSEAKIFLESFNLLLWKDTSSDIQQQINDLNKQFGASGILNGRIKENLKYLERAKAMEKASGASVFALGEFDGARVAANRQHLQSRSEALTLNTEIDSILKKLLVIKKGTPKRQRAIDEFGQKVAELMNKNMLTLYFIGVVRENQYYINNFKLSFDVFKEEK